VTSPPPPTEGEEFPGGAALPAAVEAPAGGRHHRHPCPPVPGAAGRHPAGPPVWPGPRRSGGPLVLARPPAPIELAALGAGRLPSPADPPVPEPPARSPVAFQPPAAGLSDPAKAKLVDLLAGLPAVQTAYLFQTGTSAGPARLALAVVLAPGSRPTPP
jgi:hypothetical protein